MPIFNLYLNNVIQNSITKVKLVEFFIWKNIEWHQNTAVPDYSGMLRQLNNILDYYTSTKLTVEAIRREMQ